MSNDINRGNWSHSSLKKKKKNSIIIDVNFF